MPWLTSCGNAGLEADQQHADPGLLRRHRCGGVSSRISWSRRRSSWNSKRPKDHNDVFTAQCLNYLKATGLPVCLLLNFGKPRLEIKRYTRIVNPTTSLNFPVSYLCSSVFICG